jgi:class 3 adenylate cyclase
MNGQSLEFGLAPYVGEVAYGNIGAARRLGFTVIGPSVNQVARLQEVSKQLGHTLVLSRAFSRLAGQRVEELGCFTLRGIEHPQRVFGLPLIGRNGLPSTGLAEYGHLSLSTRLSSAPTGSHDRNPSQRPPA